MRANNITPAFLIRTATIEDLDGLTLLHCNSFQPEDHIPVMLGKDYVRAMYRWLVTSSQAYCLVAEVDRQIIGMVAVCDNSFTRPMFLACLPEFIRSLLRSPGLIFGKRLWERLLRDTNASDEAKRIVDHPGFAQLIIVAVDTQRRGTGIFPALVEAAKAYSKKRDSKAIRAGVYKFNEASRKAFTKVGWVELPELETYHTVFYVSFLDPEFLNQLEVVLPSNS